ncbi:uncharacterized protein Tco025E_04889 [Trypanosoma conorhini]|uniref:Uncharacterized protein n=1 Tax=Trypanosoma conorhini TaxID=83891 RepID=A0A3S5ITA6_9TRYP|nr:uncharacterized protein Tco025E_04889 [Trypanosoma conorhini]RNF17248.1 hypothetical protein Tco025E_04889 [Trypanosoma conorhini]
MRASWVLTDVFSIALGRSHPNVARGTYSGRHARQMGRRCGPAPHHVVFPGAVVKKETTPPGKTTDTPLAQMNASLQSTTSTGVRTRAVELGLVSEEADSAFAELCGGGSSTSKDPLLEFLEKNEEDAALLLAMWTSLRRSCLHASEISESLSLTTRWFLHHLIRMRAIAAAVRFYQRLLALGVQLQKWDVVLLLSNLPYDRSTTVAESHSEAWMQENRPSRWAERRRREQRGRGEDVTLTPHKRADTAGCGGAGKDEGGRPGMGAGVVTPNTAAPSQPTYSASGGSASVAQSKTDGNTVGAVKQPHSQKQDWVRQWLLYEASMGNIEFPDGEECGGPVTCDGRSDASHFSDAVEADADMLQDSLEAHRLMGVMAQLKHLMLLQDAGILVATNRTPSPHRCAISVAGGASATRHRRYWAEALHLAGVYVRSIPATRDATSLPEELLEITRRAVMCSQSWKVALHYLELAKRHDVALSRKDYAKFVLIAAEEEPWRKSRRVEECMTHHVLPHLSNSTAAGYAVRALWLVYACSLKLDRPEDYVELVGSQARNLPAAIKEAIMFAKLAVSHLHIEVDRYRAEAAAQELLATSLRKGLFSTVGESTPENSPSLLTKPNEETAPDSCTGEILSEWLRDSLFLVCISLPRVIAVAPILVISQEDAVQLTSFLVDVLYSRMGVWEIFSKLYLGKAEASARRAPERSSIAASMALCVLRVALALCAAHGEFASRQRGVVLLTPKQLTLLLGMGVEALGAIPSHACGNAELRSVMASLARTAVRLTKEVCRLFDLSPGSERLLFGVASEEKVGSLVLMVRVLLLLHADAPGRRFPVTTQVFLRSLFRPNSGLGKQVRRSLQQKEVDQLDALLYRRAHARTSAEGGSPSTRRLQTFSSEDVARIAATAEMHNSIYSIAVQHEGDSSAVEGALGSRLRTMQSGEACLLLHVALHHLRLRPGTFGMAFFLKVLERLRSGATSEAHGSSLWLKAISVYWDAVEHTAAHSGSLSTAGVSNRKRFQEHEREVLSAFLLPMMQLSMAMRRRDLGWVWLDRWASLYTPVERDTCWAMRNVQARSTLRDRRGLHMCLELVKNESKKAAMEGTLVESPPAPVTSLLCEVAVRHADWREALESLLQPFVHSASSGSPVIPLPSLVSSSALRILCRAPTNLSNTALRLRTIQGEQWDLQSANGLLLLLLRQRRWKLALQHVKEMYPLLDGVTDTPAGSTSSCSTSNITENNSKDEEQMKVNQALFLLYGLRACAIGGSGEEAALLYDRVKALFTKTNSDSSLEKTNNNGSATQLEELLFSSFNPDEVATSVSAVGDENARLGIITGQARRYFLRAMTKKSLTSQGLRK